MQATCRKLITADPAIQNPINNRRPPYLALPQRSPYSTAADFDSHQPPTLMPPPLHLLHCRLPYSSNDLCLSSPLLAPNLLLPLSPTRCKIFRLRHQWSLCCRRVCAYSTYTTSKEIRGDCRGRRRRLRGFNLLPLPVLHRHRIRLCCLRLSFRNVDCRCFHTLLRIKSAVVASAVTDMNTPPRL